VVEFPYTTPRSVEFDFYLSGFSSFPIRNTVECYQDVSIYQTVQAEVNHNPTDSTNYTVKFTIPIPDTENTSALCRFSFSQNVPSFANTKAIITVQSVSYSQTLYLVSAPKLILLKSSIVQNTPSSSLVNLDLTAHNGWFLNLPSSRLLVSFQDISSGFTVTSDQVSFIGTPNLSTSFSSFLPYTDLLTLQISFPSSINTSLLLFCI